ncbi:unnamed protein product, partial [Prunus brigantina]
MSNLGRVLERQEQEDEEIKRRRAEEDCEADEEEEGMVVAVCMLNESRQHHRRRGPNVDRHRQSRGKNLLEDYFIPNSLYHKYDVVGVLGLLHKQKLTAALRMLAYGASTKQVNEIAWIGKSTIIECLVRLCDAVENLYKREFPKNDWKHRLHALTVEELPNCLAMRLWESKGPKKYNFGGRNFIRHLGLACVLQSCRISE